jgi:acyl dehydratase
MEDVSVSAEAKAMIGKQAAPQTCEVSLTAIRRFARAIGDGNPLYVDEEYARETQWRGIIAPPDLLLHPRLLR